MELTKYMAENNIGIGIQSHHFTVSSLKYASPMHTHDYFEIFFITEGKAIHKVNGERQYLSEGSLVFMRPEDVHCYENYEEYDCKFINICYTRECISETFKFIGSAFKPERFLEARLPLITILSSLEIDEIVGRLDKINALALNDKELLDIQRRGLLVDILLKFFWQYRDKNKKEMPEWMETLLINMQKSENFILGITRLYELSGKSIGHVNRVFRKVLACTPVEYINDLKLKHAKHLLLTTNMDVTYIALESGFENLSHFYHMFKRKYNVSPLNLRRGAFNSPLN
ncbi:AraC family transcriptional regulator [Clostridium sp. 19966]|uniref:AraC family transcriptional regulator n=1 Tax=Clostridium sp. 19966 TaxID=2768166 RepID=UPI0028DDBBBB|nr:helix-turn-helix transcriptional regulator [Clostridium sp. 19966]MDT8715682.1 AraC family transcriptional regulator [Clostridium sp. 19966]